MKLLVAILNHDDGPDVCHGLTRAGFSVTRLSTSGGFLRAGNLTILVGLEDNQVDTAMIIIRENSQSRLHILPQAAEGQEPLPDEVAVGGATVFILNVDRFEKL